MLCPRLAGNVNVAADKITASLKYYSDGNVQAFTASLDGTVAPKDVIWGDYVRGQDFGRFVLDYLPLYDGPSAPSKLEGIWTFNQASSGSVFLHLHSPLTQMERYSDGKVSIIDSRFNLYRLSLESSLCGELDGFYEGLAFFSEGGPVGR